MKSVLRELCLAAGIVLAFGAFETSLANGIIVTNVALMNATNGSAEIHFDLNWQNSWRSEWTDNGGQSFVTNWDAAWVFVKCRVSAGDWQLAWFNTSGHSIGSGTPAGMVIDVGTNGGAVNPGVFIHRGSTGSGAVSLTNIVLSWNYQAGGLYSTNQVDISVLATEMVYVPQGAFILGSGSSIENSSFESFTNRASTFLLTNEAALTMGPIPGALNWFNNTTTNVLPAAFPKGFASFYGMKYEITQGQYADFLNRYAGSVPSRYPGLNPGRRALISYNGTNYVTAAPDRACNFLIWDDVCAFAAWSGLRPMTELEFEKLCRGFKTNAANEVAFGNGAIVSVTAFTGVDGSGTETVANAGANINADQIFTGPVRAGLFSTAGTTRNASGSGYFGNMELSGNLWEQIVNLGTASGRSFAGSHGDGGLAIPADWPLSAAGNGIRGGSWFDSTAGVSHHTSDRGQATTPTTSRSDSIGARCGRTAP